MQAIDDGHLCPAHADQILKLPTHEIEISHGPHPGKCVACGELTVMRVRASILIQGGVEYPDWLRKLWKDQVQAHHEARAGINLLAGLIGEAMEDALGERPSFVALSVWRPGQDGASVTVRLEQPALDALVEAAKDTGGDSA